MRKKIAKSKARKEEHHTQMINNIIIGRRKTGKFYVHKRRLFSIFFYLRNIREIHIKIVPVKSRFNVKNVLLFFFYF